MTIELGTTDINKLYLGSAEIKKAYLGSTTIFDNTAPASGWVQTNAGLDLGYGGEPACCMVRDGVSVLMNPNTDVMETYRLIGGVWTHITGADVTAPRAFNNSASAYNLEEDQIIMAPQGSRYIKYVWDDVLETWSTASDEITLSGNCELAPTSGTRFFAYRRIGDVGVSTYNLVGSTWTKTGNVLTIPSDYTDKCICVLDYTVDSEVLLAMVNGTAADGQNEAYVISYDGGTETLTEDLVQSIGTYSIGAWYAVAINDSGGFAHFTTADRKLRYGTWDGTTLDTAVSTSDDIGNAVNGVLGGYNNNTNTVLLSGAGAGRPHLQMYQYVEAV